MDAATVGEAAGRVWQQLYKSGPAPLKGLFKDLGLGETLTCLALGWLCREGKVRFEGDGRKIIVTLTEEELKKSRP